MELKRFRVFGKGEKKNLAQKLMVVYFLKFEKVDLPMKNLSNIYLEKGEQKIILDYSNDQFTYYGKISKKDIWLFKGAYEKTMARKLEIIVGPERKDDLFSKLNSPNI